MKLRKKLKKVEKNIFPFYFGFVYSLGLIFGAEIIIAILKAITPLNKILEDSAFLVAWGLLFLLNNQIMSKGEFRRNIIKTSLILLVITLIAFTYKYLIR